MSDNESIRRVVEEVEYLRAKRAQSGMARPHLVVVHGCREPGTLCRCGESIEHAMLVIGSRTFEVALSPSGLVTLDILIRKRPTPLTAAQIERISLSDPFYLRLGANALGTQRKLIRLGRRSIKVFIQRFRQQLDNILREAGFSIRAEDMLISEGTELKNVTAYRLTIPCTVVHPGEDADRKQFVS